MYRHGKVDREDSIIAAVKEVLAGNCSKKTAKKYHMSRYLLEQKVKEHKLNFKLEEKQNFFHHLPPTHSPFGYKMLEGMGWRQGEAIGKHKEGLIAPISIDVRFGRQGLCTKEEKEKFDLGQSKKPIKKVNPIKNIEGKHPVSLLAEHCQKRQIAMPEYNIIFDYGSYQSKSVLVSVTVAGQTFEPSQPSPYNKHAKAVAATLALTELGFIGK